MSDIIFGSNDQKKIKFIYGSEINNSESSLIKLDFKCPRAISNEKQISFLKNKATNKVKFNDNVKVELFNSMISTQKSLKKEDSLVFSPSSIKKDNFSNMSVKKKDQTMSSDSDTSLLFDPINIYLENRQYITNSGDSGSSLEMREFNVSQSFSKFKTSNKQEVDSKVSKEESPDNSFPVDNIFSINKEKNIDSIGINSDILEEKTDKISSNKKILYNAVKLPVKSSFVQVRNDGFEKLEILKPLKSEINNDNKEKDQNMFEKEKNVYEKESKPDLSIKSIQYFDSFQNSYNETKRRSSKIGEIKYDKELNDVFKKIYNRNKESLVT
jgi:hypothetical protein